MSTTVIRKCQLVPVSKLYKYSESSNLVHTLVNSQQPWVPLSSCVRLKMNVIDAHNAGEDKKIPKRCQLAVSTVRTVFKRWQLRGTVEVKMRWKTNKTLGENCSYAGQKGKSKPPFYCRKPAGRFSRLRSGGAPFLCAAMLAQTRPSWKSQ